MTRTRIGLDDDGQHLRLWAGPRDTGLIRQVPGWTADHRQPGTWKARPSWSVALATQAVLGDALAVDDSAWTWAEVMKAREKRSAVIKDGRYPPFVPLAKGLRPYQMTGALFMAEMGAVLNADQMGTGKTVQTLAALAYLLDSGKDPFPAIVVCTNSMKHTWVEEAEKWLPGGKYVALTGSRAKREKALAGGPDLVSVNWESAWRLTRLAGYGSLRLADKEREPGPLNALGARTVIADEAHRMKDPKAKQTRGVWYLGQQAEWRFALTGTPVANEPADLWAIMHFLAPDEWPSRPAYLDRYTVTGLNFWGGLETYGFDPGTRDELDRFFQPRFIRRTKAEVLPDLPPKLPSATHWVEMEPKQAKAYNAMRDQMIALVEDEIIIAADPLSKLTRLLQFAAATPVVGPVDDEGKTSVLALEKPSCKLNALLDVLEEGGDDPLVVFAASRKLIDLCETELRKRNLEVVTITGSVSTEMRKLAVDTFQHGDAQVCLCTLGAGSEGLTLTAASTALFLQRSFSAVQNQQAEDRIHRWGQDRPVQIVDVVTRDTLEVAVHEVYAEKQATLQELVRDPAWVLHALGA